MFVFKKRNLVIISVLVVTAIAFIVCFGALTKRGVDQTSVNKIRVVLDAGHGGIDGGVCGVKTGVKESELNLKVVKLVEKYLISVGMSVTLTRNSDAGLYGLATSNLKKKDMQKRRDIIRSVEPHLVVSIHMNKYSVSTRRGAQVFYKPNDEMAKLLANNLQTCFNQMEQAVRECTILTGDYYILNCSDYPSVIVECGFLSNPEDETLLLTNEYQDALAYNIFKGIVGYLTEISLEAKE